MFVIVKTVDSYDGSWGVDPYGKDVESTVVGYSETKDECIKWIEKNAKAVKSTTYGHKVEVSEFHWIDDTTYQANGKARQRDEVYTIYTIESVNHI